MCSTVLFYTYFLELASIYFQFFYFLYPMLSSAASVMDFLIFSQSVSTFPVISVSLPFNMFLYKVLMNSCSNKCPLNLRRFFCIGLSLIRMFWMYSKFKFPFRKPVVTINFAAYENSCVFSVAFQSITDDYIVYSWPISSSFTCKFMNLFVSVECVFYFNLIECTKIP